MEQPRVSVVGKSGKPGRGMMSKGSRSFHHYASPVLRFLQLFACVTSFAVMIRSSQLGLSYASFQAFQFLIAGTVIAGFWAFVSFILDLILLCTGRRATSPALAILRALLDFTAASIALAAGAAAAGITTFNDSGSFPYQQTVCQGATPWSSFCARTKAATALAFIAFFFFIPSIMLDIGTVRVALEESVE